MLSVVLWEWDGQQWKMPSEHASGKERVLSLRHVCEERKYVPSFLGGLVDLMM